MPTDAGSVTFRVRHIDQATTFIRLQFTVHDTGRGIRAAVLPTLIQRLRDSRTAGRYGGTGLSLGLSLGLTISWKLMSLMGGTIELNSEEGRGTAMIVTVRLDKDLRASSGPDSEPGPHVIINQGRSSVVDCRQAEDMQHCQNLAHTQQSTRSPERKSEEVT